MATVVYKPPTPSTSSAVGGALGLYAAGAMQQEAEAQKAQNVARFVEAIRVAPDRAAGLEVISNYAPMFKTTDDYMKAYKILDQYKPAEDERVQPYTMYDPSGNPTTVGMTPERFKRETAPSAVGTMYPGMSFTKPNLVDFYMPGEGDKAPTFVGKLPEDKRPAGAMTQSEVTLERQARREAFDAAESRKRDERFAANQKQIDENQSLSERRLQAMLGRIAAMGEKKDVDRRQDVVRNAAKQAALMLNAKVLPDGSLGFDSTDKADLYQKHLDYIDGIVATQPKRLDSPNAEISIASEARRAVMGEAKKAEPVKEPVPKKKSGISNILPEGLSSRGAAGKESYLDRSGGSYSRAEIEQAAQAMGMSVDQFITRKGLTRK